MARTNAARGLSGRQAWRQGCDRGLCAAVLVASAALSASTLSSRARAVCARLVARGNHRPAVTAACNHRGSAPVLRRTLSAGGKPALTWRCGACGSPGARQTSRPSLEAVENLTEHRRKHARGDGCQHRIAELVVHRKMHPRMRLVLRLKPPERGEIPQGSIGSVDANLTAERVSRCPVGITDLKCRKANGHSRHDDGYARLWRLARQQPDVVAMRHELRIALHVENEIE